MVENDLQPGSAGSSLMVTVGTGAGGGGGGGGVGAIRGDGDDVDGGEDVRMLPMNSVSSENVIGATVETCCWNDVGGVDINWSRDTPRLGLFLNISAMASFTLDSND